MAGLALLATRRLELRGRLPFGLFLAFGGLTALFVGERLVTAYVGLL